MTAYYQMRQKLLQNATAILLQTATKVYYKMGQVFHCKMRQFSYKMRKLLQNATILLQNATVHTFQIQLLNDVKRIKDSDKIF